MKKTQLEGSKSPPSRKPNALLLAPSPRKEFQLLYRERDPDHEQPYENIIFMKSKKCPKRKPDNKPKDQPVHQLKEMVAQIEKQLKEKQRQSKEGKESAKGGKSLGSAKNLFKNKQIKDTFHSKASSRWTKYRKQEALAPENVRKYKNMLSPTRAPKIKEDTLSSKFLRSTQETFRKEKAAKRSKQELPAFSLPEEYVLLQDNFVQLNHQNLSLLQLKIPSIKLVSQKKQPETTKAFPTCSQFGQSHQQPHSLQLLTEKGIQKAFTQEKLEEEEVQEEEELEEDEQEEVGRFSERQMLVMEMYMVSKVKLIQRWWRQVMTQKQKNLDPIVFRKCNQEFEESMLFLHSGLKASEVSPIKMIDCLNAERIKDHPSEEKRHSEDRMDSLRLREEAAGQQLQTHLQLLQELLQDKRISSETFFEKKAVIEAKYQHELQQIGELEKLMSENTQRAYQITIKTQQDRNHLQHLSEVDDNTLDQIFGKDFQHPSPIATPLPSYEMMIVNREKSTGCHFDGEEKLKPSIYQKRPDEDYEDDFQQEEEDEGQMVEGEGEEAALEEYNANFTQLLGEYKCRQEMKMEIDRRAAIQMGALVEQIPEQVRAEHIGIDTSLNSIHRFVLSFFKFYIFYYKDEFLRLINMPYGYNIDHRLSFLHGYEEQGPQEDQNGYIYGLDAVISDDILDEFYEKVYDLTTPMSAARRANFQFERFHNRCLLDCFNEALNHFRPYFLINGPPYPWNHSEKALTFYFIAEENIQEVFQKSQFKLLRWASTLCGIIPGKHSESCPAAQGLPTEQALQLYRKNTHPDLIQTRQDRLTKDERTELTENNHEWGMFEEQSTSLKLESADYVFSKLVQEFVVEYIMALLQPQAQFQAPFSKNFDFYQGPWDESQEEHA